MLDKGTFRCVLFLSSFLQDSITPKHSRNGNSKKSEYLMADGLEIKAGLLQIYTAHLAVHIFYLDTCYTFIDGYKTAGLRQE